jgi:hypothetical protein
VPEWNLRPKRDGTSRCQHWKFNKGENGNFNVPATHPTLGKWVSDQRAYYKLDEQQWPNPLTDNRFQKLKSCWHQPTPAWLRHYRKADAILALRRQLRRHCHQRYDRPRTFDHGYEIHLERATLGFEFAVIGDKGK